HQPERFAVPLRVRHPEPALQVLLRVVPFLVTYHHNLAVAKRRKPSDDCRVIPEGSVAMKLHEVVEHESGIVERERTVRMTRKLYPLPPCKLLEDVRSEPLDLLFEDGDLIGDIELIGHRPHVGDLLFEL